MKPMSESSRSAQSVPDTQNIKHPEHQGSFVVEWIKGQVKEFSWGLVLMAIKCDQITQQMLTLQRVSSADNLLRHVSLNRSGRLQWKWRLPCGNRRVPAIRHAASGTVFPSPDTKHRLHMCGRALHNTWVILCEGRSERGFE
jgi:hypothetical protein